MKPEELTIRDAQQNQPWTVPYSKGFNNAVYNAPHLHGSHDILHAAKTVGKLAAIFEALDHTDIPLTPEQRGAIAGLAADLLAEALRLANLYDFDLASVFVQRVNEKNKCDILGSIENADRGSLTNEPCRCCHQTGGVYFVIDDSPFGRNTAQVVACEKCKNSWTADGPNA